MENQVLFFFVAFCGLIGFWADNKGRRWWLWVGIAALLSPLIAGLGLLIAGDAKNDL